MWLRALLLVGLLARFAGAQTPDTGGRALGTTVSGVVRDSLARAPLAGAMVQLVAAHDPAAAVRTAVSDSLGRYTLDGVPAGRYALGFLHPMLDSLGVEPPLREVVVDGRNTVRADLATPAPAALRAAICGPQAASESGAVVAGVVRDARDGAPAAGVTVAGEWLELSIGPKGVGRRVPHLAATTGANGWFAICNVPRDGTMMLTASRGADSTNVIEVHVPAHGFLQRDLYLGATRTRVATDTTRRPDSAAPQPRRIQTGDGRLSGTVVAAEGGRPLAGAHVSIVDGPQTRANDLGEWTLADAPVGTRMLEVRAVGYYPERRAVHVVQGAAPVRVVLATLKAVLDTMKVTARRVERDRNGFEERRRRGAGRYLTAADVARHRPILASDVFRNVPGVRLEADETRINKLFVMRGPFGDCSPAVYLNGLYFDRLGADDIDSWMRPHEIAGIEIYSEAAVPPEFRRLNDRPGEPPCGSIVIWTR